MEEFYLKTDDIKVPNWMMDISYNGKIIPNGTVHDMQLSGANCQVFSYYLLRLNGKVIPELRSSELWANQEFSKEVTIYEPLDIVFFSKNEKAWGAHVGVFINPTQVLHLARKQVKPVVWDLAHFHEYEEYKVLIGVKRFFDQ